MGDDALKYLDERGIIMVGAEVTAGDILVGKVTPKGEAEATAEAGLLIVIFTFYTFKAIKKNKLKSYILLFLFLIIFGGLVKP